MDFTTIETVSLVKTSRRDQFLAAMFLPLVVRENVVAIYAFDIELEHIHHVVKEEMMGHIRYAWWQEAVEQLINEGTAREHPLIKALVQSSINPQYLLPILSAYRENYPEIPADIEKITDDVVGQYIADSIKNHKWEKAVAAIKKHRAKHGRKYNNWLLIKLLFV